MKIWLDDIRTPPSCRWAWCKNVPQAKFLLKGYPNLVEVLSCDNDLGEGEEEGRALVLWLAETEVHWPREVWVHSSNPVAAEAMRGIIKRYKPKSRM